MRSFGFAVAVAWLFVVTSADAAPNQPPAFPFPFPSPSPQALPTVPQLLAPLQQLQSTVAACPSVEVAPGVRIPMCLGTIPAAPAGSIVPEAWFPPVPVQPWVDLRQRGLDGPVMDQQQAGVCYAFAMADVLDNSLRRQGRPFTLSPLHVIASDSWGKMFGDTRPEPVTAEQTWPYSPVKACELEATSDGTCTQAYGVAAGSWQRDPVTVADRARARAYGVATAQKATQISKANAVFGITQALSGGRAVWLAIDIDTDAWGFRNVKDGHLRDYDVADRGAHAVAVVGYRTDGYGREYLLHNSWGEGWGDHGYVWITEAGLKKHFESAYLLEAR